MEKETDSQLTPGQGLPAPVCCAPNVHENPDSILELFPDGCPNCGSKALEALTWKSRKSDAVTVGCWDCEWIIEPEDSIPEISDDLKEWTRRKLAEVKGRVIKAGDHVRFAGSVWEVAEVKQFPHGPMIGIYDEPPGKHVDYLNPGSVTLVHSHNKELTDGPAVPSNASSPLISDDGEGKG